MARRINFQVTGRRLTLFGFSVGIQLLCGLPALAQREPNDRPLPQDADELVALMAGEDLPWMAQKRAIPQTPGWRAAMALVTMKDDALPALTKGLDSEDHLLRVNVIYVLKRIGTPATLPLRIQSVSDPHPAVRRQAIAGLSAYADDKTRRTLLKSLEDPDPAVRNAAIETFRPLDRENPPDNAIRFATANVLIGLLDDPATQLTAASVLGKLGMNVASRPLLELLDAEDKHVRYAAVVALGELKDKQVAVELTAALRDEDPYVRDVAVRSLGQIADLRTVPALVDLLSDEQAYIRRDTAAALGQVGDLRVVPWLLSLLDDSDEQVRGAAADALGHIGDRRAVEPLCKALIRNGRESASAARALGHLSDPRSIEPLTRFLLAPDARPDCSDEAATALAQIRHPDSVASLVKVVLETGDDEVRRNARLALAELTGVSFSFEPKETIASWWEQNRADYLRPISDEQ